MIDAEDVQYLEVVEAFPFNPIGHLWESIYADLQQRGLVKLGLNGYMISKEGQQELDQFRNQEPPEPDGEDFRGNESYAFLQEQQANAQRLK